MHLWENWLRIQFSFQTCLIFLEFFERLVLTDTNLVNLMALFTPTCSRAGQKWKSVGCVFVLPVGYSVGCSARPLPLSLWFLFITESCGILCNSWSVPSRSQFISLAQRWNGVGMRLVELMNWVLGNFCLSALLIDTPQFPLRNFSAFSSFV